MENKIGFKKTELGYIPADWKVVRLGDVCNVKGEYGINAAAVEFSEKLPTYLRITDISDSGNFLKDGKKSVLDPNFEKFILNKGDIVFARTGATVGKTYLYDEKDGELVFAGFLIRFSPNDKVLDSYFLKLFTSTNIYWNWVTLMSMRSGQPGINAQEYSSLKVILPPLPEQQKIASILSKWDELIETQTQLIEEKEKQKKGLMQKLLTGEVRFPGVEEEWEEVRLGDICKTFSGGTPRRNRKEYYNGDIPWIKSGELNSPNIYSTEENITELGLKNSSAKLVPANTVLLAMYGATAGVISITRIEAAVNQAILVIQPSESLNYLFLYYFLNFVMPFELQRLIQGGQPNLSADVVKSIKLAIPSISEQNKITSFLSSVDEEIQLLKDKLEAIKLQKKGLMQQLLTGRIRVKI